VLPALLARMPRVGGPAESPPVIPDEARTAFPDLARDLDVLARDVAPAFRDYDLQALREQQRYRRQQFLILLGSVLGTAFGALQAAVPDEEWPGALLILLGVLLATSSRWSGERASFGTYLDARLKAERLQALHFQYLSGTGRYAGPNRDLELRRAVWQSGR
jgi:hypothetical protein